jgi:hypothetical protein
LMGNHYHFVLYTRQANLSLLIRHPLRHDHECGCPRAWLSISRVSRLIARVDPRSTGGQALPFAPLSVVCRHGPSSAYRIPRCGVSRHLSR